MAIERLGFSTAKNSSFGSPLFITHPSRWQFMLALVYANRACNGWSMPGWTYIDARATSHAWGSELLAFYKHGVEDEPDVYEISFEESLDGDAYLAACIIAYSGVDATSPISSSSFSSSGGAASGSYDIGSTTLGGSCTVSGAVAHAYTGTLTPSTFTSGAYQDIVTQDTFAFGVTYEESAFVAADTIGKSSTGAVHFDGPAFDYGSASTAQLVLAADPSPSSVIYGSEVGPPGPRIVLPWDFTELDEMTPEKLNQNFDVIVKAFNRHTH